MLLYCGFHLHFSKNLRCSISFGRLSTILFQSHLGEWHHHSPLGPLWESSKWHWVSHRYTFRSSCPWISFYVLIYHLYSLFGEVPVHIFYLFFNWVVCSYYWILRVLTFYWLYDLHVFFPTLTCHFLLTVSLAEQKILILMKSN